MKLNKKKTVFEKKNNQLQSYNYNRIRPHFRTHAKRFMSDDVERRKGVETVFNEMRQENPYGKSI